jgi:transposase
MATAEARRQTRKGCPNRAVEFKREIAAAACAPGISVAKLALEHGVNANLLFKWRREYRAGKFGAPDPAHRPASSCADLAVAEANQPEPAVTLLPVQVPAAVADVIAASACIEVLFRSATVRICGAPEVTSLRVVLDTLARRS